MRKSALVLAASATLVLSAVTAPSPAQARYWGHGYGGWGAGLVGGLIAGAVIGGIASSAYGYGPYGYYGGYPAYYGGYYPAYYGGYYPAYYGGYYPGYYGGYYRRPYYAAPRLLWRSPLLSRRLLSPLVRRGPTRSWAGWAGEASTHGDDGRFAFGKACARAQEPYWACARRRIFRAGSV